jgi:hypothetical protein
MYSVSADYLTALAQPVHKYRLSGTVGTEAFNQSNIISGSLSITNKVSEGSEIKLGSVYTGELRATFTGLSIARGSWVGKKITLSEGLQLADESFEDVPLGVFTIAEATHKADGVSVVAYDAMTAFDKARNDLTETGTAYDFLSLMCQKCGVTLGMTSADVAALTNGTETLSIYSENDIETWRDLLSWVAQTLCSVATINRAGELELRQYSVSSAATIDETHRFTGCSFSDFTTHYTGMSVVNIALRQTEYKSVTPDDGLTYNLGSNPLVQGDYELVQNIIDDFSNVQLVPFSAQMLGGAIYDLCDCLTFSGGIAAGAVCGVMGYTWKHNGAYAVNGFGSNPALATAKSKAQKDIDAIYNTIGEEINQMSVVQNSSAVTCGENTETSILTYNFEVTQAENTTMVDVSVVMTSNASETEVGDVYTLSDIVAHLSFYVDGSEVSVYSPEFIVDEGKDTMTFNYSLSGLSVGAHQFDVRLTVGGGSGSIAVGDVHEMLWGYGINFEVYIKSIEVATMPDKTVFYVGETLDYDGIRVNAVYNNGLTDDVTTSCTFYPDEGTVLDEYDIGTLEVDVYYDEFSTEMELEVVRIRMLFGTTSTNVLAHVVRYNGDLFMLNDIDNSSAQTLNKVGITIGSDGIPVTGSYESLYTFPAFSPSTSRKCVQIGSKRIATPLEYVMTSGVAQAFHYYDFSDGTDGELSVSFINLATAYAITDITNSYFEHAIEVDGHIVWRETTITDSNGASVVCHAVGRVLGTSLEIRFYAGTLKDNALYGYGVDYHTRYELEHLEEQKYFFTFSNSTKVLTLNELTCDGITASYRQIWTGETELSYIGFHEYFPNGSKVALGLSWLVDGTYVLGVYVVDIQTGTAEYHYSSDRDSDPMYICMLKRVSEDGQHEGIYDPQLGKYVCCRGTLDSETTTVLYLSDDLIDWTIVSGIDNNLGVVADAAWPYAPLETGVLVGSFKRRNYAYEYLAQLRFSNLE